MQKKLSALVEKNLSIKVHRPVTADPLFFKSKFNFSQTDDDDELMLNVLRCHLTY